MTTHDQVEQYERSIEVFGRCFGWRTQPLTLQGLDGVAVYAWSDTRGRGGVLEAWFLSHDHACRWIDTRVGSLA